MLVTKLLEGTLPAGQTSIQFTDTAIPNSFIRVGGSNPDIYPTEQTVSGNTLTLTYEAQSSAFYIIVELVKASMLITDELTSDAADEALSAKQGKVLKGLIDAFSVPTVEQLTDVEVEDLQSDDILIYDAVEEKWVNASLPSVPESINDLTDVDITSPLNGQILSYDNGSWININSSGASDDYTTTETQIGTYLGAPLYRKVITGLNISLNQNAWTTLTGVTIANGKDLVNAVCYGTYTEQYIINCTKVHLDSTTGNVEVRNIESSTTLTAIMFEYTKSS